MSSTDQPAADVPARRSKMRTPLLVVAAIETVSALSDLPIIFVDYEAATPLLAFAQYLTKTQIAAAVLIAIAALVFAIRDWLRHAIAALAILMLTGWIADVPSFFIHGLQLSGGFWGVVSFGPRFFYPVFALIALILVVRNERLGLAAILVSVPTIVSIVGILAFALSVILLGL
jgi:hypothetical protein